MGRQEIKNSLPYDKLPPHNVEAEQAVLGAMLLNERIVPDIVDSIRPELFYKSAHQKIFSVMSAIFNKGRNVDIVTVANELKTKGELESVGGNLYLSKLVENVPSAANAAAYGRIIKEKGILRQLINSAYDIVNICYEPHSDVGQLIDEAEKKLFQVSLNKDSESCVAIKDVVHDAMEKIDALYQNKNEITGLSSGFKSFDKLTSGLHGGELIIVAARPAMGKSSFVNNIAEHLAVDKKQPVLMFTMEMSSESIAQRFLCTRARVDAQKVRSGFFSQDQWPQLTGAASEFAQAPLYIDDRCSTLYDVRSTARRMKTKNDIQLIIIDYLQLMSKGGRTESRQLEISEISRSLKLLSLELNIPIIALSQLSREVEKREDRRPRLSDLRESGSIEQDADMVLFLYRDEYYHPEKVESEGRADVIIGKHRNGPTGEIQMAFIKEYMLFAELDTFHQE